MIKKNLNNDVTIRNFLNQCEITEKISDLCNITADISLNLYIKQEIDLNFSDWSVFTENSYMSLSRKIEKKDSDLTEFICENFQETDLSRSADIADIQQLVLFLSVINTERKTAYINMLVTEFIQIIYKQQKLDF